MAFQPPASSPDFKALLAALNNSGFQRENNALYQVIKGLIDASSKLQTNTSASITALQSSSGGGSGGGGGSSGGATVNGTYLTWSSQIAQLPSSRQLIAGTGISFDDTVAGERIINSTLPGTNLDLLTNGDNELIFAGGNVVWVDLP